MSATPLNERRYGKLVSAALPPVIRTEAEYRRLLEIARALMDRPDEDLGEEEGRLLELLGLLVAEYEDREHPLPKADPAKMLRHFLKERGMQPRDLTAVLPRSRISEILNGKRSIRKSQAKQLAELFRVSAELFL